MLGGWDDSFIKTGSANNVFVFPIRKMKAPKSPCQSKIWCQFQKWFFKKFFFIRKWRKVFHPFSKIGRRTNIWIPGAPDKNLMNCPVTFSLFHGGQIRILYSDCFREHCKFQNKYSLVHLKVKQPESKLGYIQEFSNCIWTNSHLKLTVSNF